MRISGPYLEVPYQRAAASQRIPPLVQATMKSTYRRPYILAEIEVMPHGDQKLSAYSRWPFPGLPLCTVYDRTSEYSIRRPRQLLDRSLLGRVHPQTCATHSAVGPGPWQGLCKCACAGGAIAFWGPNVAGWSSARYCRVSSSVVARMSSPHL